MVTFIKKETLQFLNALKQNNNRDWFTENKPLFTNAQDNFKAFVDELIPKIALFDTTVEKLEAKNCIFRIYRDTRFSKDKTPYKTNFGAAISKGKGLASHAGYYIHLEPDNCFIAGGIYMPEPKNLKAIRQEISDYSEDFLKIIRNQSLEQDLKLDADKLIKVPQGFDKENPMAEYLKFKHFTVIHYLKNEQILKESFLEYCSGIFEKMYPFNCFLNRAIQQL